MGLFLRSKFKKLFMAIESSLNFYLAIWQTIILGLNSIVMASSIKRYAEKKSDVAAKLSIAFIFFFLANLFNVIGICVRA
jgi:hypothetical protein